MMKRINILYFIPELNVGGAETVLKDLVLSIDKAKFKVVIWCTDEAGFYKKILNESGIDVFVGTFKERKFDVFGLIKTIIKIRKLKIDIVHSHFFRPTFWDVLIARLCGVRVVLTSRHDMGYWRKENTGPSLTEKFRNFLTTEIIAVSEAVKTAIAKAELIPLRRIKVLYNGADFNNMKSSKNNGRLKKSFGFNEKTKIIGSVGRLRTVKGFNYLIEAFSILCKDNDNLKLMIVGHGGSEKELKRLTKSLGIEESVVFTGVRDDVIDLLSIFDIFVFPSISEGFGGALLEACITKKPIVSTRCGGPEEIIRDGISGILVPKADYKVLAEGMLKLLNNPVLAEKLASEAKKNAIINFSLQSTVKKYEEYYSSFFD